MTVEQTDILMNPGNYRIQQNSIPEYMQSFGFVPVAVAPQADGYLIVTKKTDVLIVPTGQNMFTGLMRDYEGTLERIVAFGGLTEDDQEGLSTTEREITFAYNRTGQLIRINVMTGGKTGCGMKQRNGLWVPFFHVPFTTPLDKDTLFYTLDAPVQKQHSNPLLWLSQQTGCELHNGGEEIVGAYQTEGGDVPFRVPVRLIKA